MRVNVLKADHHGSCNGVDDEYLRALHPDLAVVSVGHQNGYGHMHTQAKAIYRANRVPWYRTDENGTIVITSPGKGGDGYSVTVARGKPNMSGHSDKRSTQSVCRTRGGGR
jgi:competence protein ComEC